MPDLPLPSRKPELQKWDYRVERVAYYNEQAEPELQRLGEEGWELVAIDEGYAFLKRPLQE